LEINPLSLDFKATIASNENFWLEATASLFPDVTILFQVMN